jgi:hypothetical protein
MSRKAADPMPNTAARQPDIHALPDGARLSAPQPKGATGLHLDDWVRVDGWPWRITDLRVTGGGGRIVHLDGRSPFILTSAETVPVYTVTPAPAPAASPRR